VSELGCRVTTTGARCASPTLRRLKGLLMLAARERW